MQKKNLHLIVGTIGVVIIIATSYCVYTMNKDIDNAIIDIKKNKNIAQNSETSDWKIYRNEEYGFEVKYPQDWELSKLPDPKAGFLLESPNYNEKIYLGKTRNYDNLKIIDLIKTFNDASSAWPQEFPYKKIIINGKEAVVFENIIYTKKGEPVEGEPRRKKVFIKTNNYVFIASYLYEEKNENAEKIFNQIVEEIKFVGSLN